MKQRINFTVGQATAEDASAIARLEKESFSEPWSEAQILCETENKDAVFLSAKSDGTVLGYISGRLILDEFYISDIAVDSGYRNQGVASALLSELIRILKDKHAYFMTLEVREGNIPARRLYEKFGFRNLGIRKNFYSFPRENACIYTLYFNEVD